MDKIEKKLITDYLIRHYPFVKLKDKKRFKRGIQLIKTKNGETTIQNEFLKSDKSLIKIKEHIINDICIVFGFSRNKINDMITNYIYRR